MSRLDDFTIRSQHLGGLTDAELEERFWELTRQVVTPLLDLAKTHTTPSIERSVLQRMGFSSLESQAIVKKCSEQKLLGKGAGHLVWRLAKLQGISIRAAGLALAEGRYWDELQDYFRGGLQQ